MEAVVVDGPPYPRDCLVLVPKKNLIVGGVELARSLGQLTSLEEDLLTLAAAIFAVDLATKRGEREGFTRDLSLRVPVVNYHAFARVQSRLANILYLLSHDNWSLEFLPKQGAAEGPQQWSVLPGKTLLFSGGLDSLAAAVELLQAGDPLQLASHYTHNRVIQGSQERLYDYLSSIFNGHVSRVAARITGQRSGVLDFPSDVEREPTQRTRSFLFLAIGAIAARRTGFHELLLIAENGQMAIHLPLTAARIGAFSTHTAHPEFVHEMEGFLQTLLSFPFVVRNPFLYRTKAECISLLARSHQEAIRQSVSCWKSSRQAYAHCGECVPCLVRRIAIEFHGLRLPEYARDLLVEDISSLQPDDAGKRNIIELAEFIRRFGPGQSDAEILGAFPDLVNEHIDLAAAIGMYRRFAAEAEQVLAHYPGVQRVLT